MTSVERFYNLLDRKPIGEALCWLGIPTPEALSKLLNFFDVKNELELRKKLGDDIYPVDVAYNHAPANHIACAFDWHIAHEDENYTERTLTEKGFFADCTDLSMIDKFPWPEPSKHIDIAKCIANADKVPRGKVGLGIMWSAHFQDACAAFGMENALMTMLLDPTMFKAVIDRILEFYLQANEIFYKVTTGKIQAVLLGNDLGTQSGLMVAPETLRSLVFPGINRLIEQAHKHNLKVIYHSCGSIYPIIGDLIDAGADIIHPIQPMATNMAAETLKKQYGDHVVFCGGVDVQHLMIHGSPWQIKEEIVRLQKIFPTGLIFSPSHEAIMPDVPPENIEAMFCECKKITS